MAVCDLLTQKYRRARSGRTAWACNINFNLQTRVWPEYHEQNQTNQKNDAVQKLDGNMDTFYFYYIYHIFYSILNF